VLLIALSKLNGMVEDHKLAIGNLTYSQFLSFSVHSINEPRCQNIKIKYDILGR
jgi:hypothetical protein